MPDLMDTYSSALWSSAIKKSISVSAQYDAPAKNRLAHLS
jgi:hypothetical protein